MMMVKLLKDSKNVGLFCHDELKCLLRKESNVIYTNQPKP